MGLEEKNGRDLGSASWGIRAGDFTRQGHAINGIAKTAPKNAQIVIGIMAN